MVPKEIFVTLTDDTFRYEVLERSGPIIVAFMAPWSTSYKTLEPKLDGLSRAYEGVAMFCKLDVETNWQTPAYCGIQSIPTLVFFLDGQVEDRLVGVPSKRELARRLNALLSIPES